MTPNAPAQEIDLYQVVNRRFRFPSAKLDYVAQRLGVGGKVSHAGQDLWTGCLAGDPASWRTMRRYNMNDVVITEGVLDKVRGWIKNPPNMGLYVAGQHVCPNCGSQDVMRNGTRAAGLSIYQRYQCRTCGAYSRDGKSIDRASLRAAA
jgi:DNA-directed RNA polymerase subunit RPC12/RpoP